MTTIKDICEKAKERFSYEELDITASDFVIYIVKKNGVYSGHTVANICKFCDENNLVFVITAGEFQLCSKL